jgi:hypothetical protein
MTVTPYPDWSGCGYTLINAPYYYDYYYYYLFLYIFFRGCFERSYQHEHHL